MNRLSTVCIGVAVGLAISAQVQGASVVTLANGTQVFSSGIDAAGNPAAIGTSDLHYSLTQNPQGPGNIAYVTIPHPAWTGDTPGSQWLSPIPDNKFSNPDVAGGVYKATTTFDLT